MNTNDRVFEIALTLLNNLSRRERRKIAKSIKNNNWDYTHKWVSCVNQAITMVNWYNNEFEEHGEEL